MPRTRRSRRRSVALTVPAVVGLLILTGVAAGTLGVLGTLEHGHPAQVILAVVVAVIGLIAIGSTIARALRPDPEPGRHRARRILTGIAAGVALILTLLAAGGLAAARPMPATAPALAAWASDAEVDLVDRTTWYELVPAGGEPERGLVFHPGAKVDARGYANLLRPLAEAGVLVIVVKEPLGFALIPTGAVDAALAAHPTVATWAIGGHSLGGVAAAATAADDDRFSGLLLWASYPGWPVDRDIAALSITGENDGVFDPQAFVDSRPLMPADTEYVEVAGANHAAFGDYGVQPGDGTLAGDRADVQWRIVELSADFLTSL